MTHESIPQSELDAMKAREEAATSDGWVWEEGTNYIWRYWNGMKVKILEHKGKLAWHKDSHCASVEAGHNLSFAAHARTDQPRLRNEIEELRKRMAELEAKLDEYHAAAQSKEGWRGE